MFRFILLSMCINLAIASYCNAQAPITISSAASFLNNNAGPGTVTFNFQNTNNYPVVITSVSGITGTTGNCVAQFWYKTSGINGLPQSISASSGFTLAATDTFVGIANTTLNSPALQTFIPSMSLTIPPNSTYGIAMYATGQRYSTFNGASTILTAGGCSLIFGTGISFGSGTPPSSPSASPRAWIGSIIFHAVPPVPDNAAIDSLVSPGIYCNTNQDVKVRVVNAGSNVLNNVHIGWSLNGVLQPPVTYNTPINPYAGIVGVNTAIVTLGSNIALGTASQHLVAWTYLPNGNTDTINTNDTLSANFQASLSGNYTVNSAMPTAGNNYQSFTGFTNAVNTYGICGPVVVNVAPGSGPYNEVLSLGNIIGSSTVNTIRVNGNGATIQYANTATNLQLLKLAGSKYVRIDSLQFKSLSNAYCWGALISSAATYDSITNCTFDLSSVKSNTYSSNNGIVFSTSLTNSNPGSGLSGTHCYIARNHLLSSADSGGMYYGIIISGTGNDSNMVINNRVENFYYYGTYMYRGNGTIIQGNEYYKTTKTASLTDFNGIYIDNGTYGSLQIIGNRMHDPGAGIMTGNFYGIAYRGYGASDTSVLIANNVIYNINQGKLIYGIYNSGGCSYTNFYHNSITIDHALTDTNANYGIYIPNCGVNTRVKNNNISITGGSSGNKYGFYYSNTTNVIDAQRNNIYLNSTQPGTQYYGYYNTTAYNTQATFQAAYPTWENGSPTVNPQFNNSAIGDLTPGNAALYGTGQNLFASVPKDILNVPRSLTPTPGAYELNSVISNDAGVSALVAPTGTFCAGVQPLTVKVTNTGINTINNVKVMWTVNGVAQPIINYNTPIYTSTSPLSDTAYVTLGNVNFTTAPMVVKAWTYLPNNTNDGYTPNDTTTTSVQASVFTINATNDTLCPTAGTSIYLTPSPGYNNAQRNWQKSTDGITWNDITNTNTSTYNTGSLPNNQYFRVKISGATNTCYSDSLKILMVNPQILSAPNVGLCGPGTVTLSASASANSIIKWYSDTTAAPLATAPIFITPNLASSTTYYVRSDIGSSPSTCASSFTPVTVNINPFPVADLGPNTNQCLDSGAVITLNAGNGQNNCTYLWDDNSTASTRQVGQSGTYSVVVTNQYLCNAVDTVQLTILPYPNVNLGNDTSVCIGSDLTLNAAYNAGNAYYWNTGQTSNNITIHLLAPNTYWVKVTNENGCFKSDSIHVATQGQLPSIDGVNISNNGSYSFQFTPVNPQHVTGYEWNFGDGSALNHDPVPVHVYPDNGVYTVTLKLSSSCGYIMDTASTAIVGIHQINIDKSFIQLYPNPSTGIVTIKNTGSFKLEQMNVYNAIGQLVYTKKSDNSSLDTLELTGLVSGIYTLQIMTDQGYVIKKLEILK